MQGGSGKYPGAWDASCWKYFEKVFDQENNPISNKCQLTFIIASECFPCQSTSRKGFPENLLNQTYVNRKIR